MHGAQRVRCRALEGILSSVFTRSAAVRLKTIAEQCIFGFPLHMAVSHGDIGLFVGPAGRAWNFQTFRVVL